MLQEKFVHYSAGAITKAFLSLAPNLRITEEAEDKQMTNDELIQALREDAEWRGPQAGKGCPK